MAPPVRTPPSMWIEAGLRALAEGGLQAVRIELLAKSLGVTRGVFYWHFDNRQALLDDMLDAWERTTTDEMMDRVEKDGGTPRDRLRRLFTLASTEEVLGIDLAVRDWSRRDPAIYERLRHVDNRRMDYLRSLYGEFCSDPDDVETRSMLSFSLFIGNHFIAADHQSRTRAQVLRQAFRHLGA